MSVNKVDQLKSIRRYVYNLYPGIPIYLSRDQGMFSRPAFLIEHVSTASRTISNPISQDDGIWQINYYTKVGMNDCLAVVDNLEQQVQTTFGFPAYLFDSQHPAPTVTVSPIAGSIPAGSYSVLVAGIGRDNNESVASISVPITLATPGAIRVTIPRLHKGMTSWWGYKVYLGAVGSEKLALDKIVQDVVSNKTVDIGTLPLAGAKAPVLLLPSTAGAENVPVSVVYDRYMKLVGINVATMEDRKTDGNFNGVLSIKTTLTRVKNVQVAPAINHVHLKYAVK